MAFLGIFKSKKTEDNIFDKDNGLLAKAGAWIGNNKLTAEEVMESNSATVNSVQDFVKATLSESTQRSKSRRNFTYMWSRMHVGIIIMSCVAAPWDKELAEFYLTLALSPQIASITAAIVIFHYGSHGLQKFQEGKKK